jgi:hypothetical protein
MYPHALAVQNSAHGTSISLAASSVKLMTSSRDRRRAGSGVELSEEAPEVRQAGLHGGAAERRHVLGGVGVGRRQAVRDGGELEVRESVQRAGAAGTEEAAVVELRVDEGDVEAPAVEDLGQLQHGRDMDLRRERHQHGVRFVDIGSSRAHAS